MPVLVLNAKTPINLYEPDERARVARNVAMILRTRAGTCPMYREFGLKQDFLDLPYEAACAVARSEIVAAVQDFEPRAEIRNITFDQDLATGRLMPTVEVNINA